VGGRDLVLVLVLDLDLGQGEGQASYRNPDTAAAQDMCTTG